jgi:hypothetical protein
VKFRGNVSLQTDSFPVLGFALRLQVARPTLRPSLRFSLLPRDYFALYAMEFLIPDFMWKGAVETAALYQTPALIAVDQRIVAGAMQRPDLPCEFKATVVVEPQASSSSVIGTVARKLPVRARTEQSGSLTAAPGRDTLRWPAQLLDGVQPGRERKRSEAYSPEVLTTFRLAGVRDIRVLASQFGTDETFFASVLGKWVASVTIKPNKSALALRKELGSSGDADVADPHRASRIKAKRVWMLFTITPTSAVDKACGPVGPFSAVSGFIDKACEPFSYVMPEPWYIASEKGKPPHLQRGLASAGAVLAHSAATEPAVSTDGTAVGGTTYSAPSAGAGAPIKRGKAKPAPAAAVSGTGVGGKRKLSSIRGPTAAATVAMPTATSAPASSLGRALDISDHHLAAGRERAQAPAGGGSPSADLMGDAGSPDAGLQAIGEVDNTPIPPAPKRSRPNEPSLESGEVELATGAPPPALEMHCVARISAASPAPHHHGDDLNAALRYGDLSDVEGEGHDRKQRERGLGETPALQPVVEPAKSPVSPSLDCAMGNCGAGAGDDGWESPSLPPGHAAPNHVRSPLQASSHGRQAVAYLRLCRILVSDLPPAGRAPSSYHAWSAQVA